MYIMRLTHKGLESIRFKNECSSCFLLFGLFYFRYDILQQDCKFVGMGKLPFIQICIHDITLSTITNIGIHKQ